jgi:hypothetical protein
MSALVIPFPRRASMRQMSRRERIEFLLDHYEDFFLMSANGVEASDDANGPALPRMSRHPSVVELCRCLAALERYAPRDFAVVKGFYTAEWRIAHAARKQDVPAAQRENAHHDSKRGTHAYRERVLSTWVRRELWRKDRAISWIAWDGWPKVPEPKPEGMPSVTVAFRGHKGEVFIPTDLLEAAA